MSGPKLNAESVDYLRETLDAATTNPEAQIPGTVFIAVNSSGEELFSHASGVRGLDNDHPMTPDSIFWIASCTKMITDQAEELVPELKAVKVLKGWNENGDMELVEKKTGITLRHLLSHTAGFGYTFFNPELKRYNAEVGNTAGLLDEMKTPLLFEPGTKFNYGTSIDWAGVILERALNTTLEEYFSTKIFEPLGIEDIAFVPTTSMLASLSSMHARPPNSKLVPMPQVALPPPDLSASERSQYPNAGGGGLFASPSSYVKIIAVLLNNGTSPTTGTQLLRKETVDSMFENQIPQMPDFGREGLQAATPELTNLIPELYPQPKEFEQGWGLTFMLTIHEGETGRGRNTGWWAGLSNLFWWADRERGVGGIIASQILPFGDPQVLGLWNKCEKAVYDGLS